MIFSKTLQVCIKMFTFVINILKIYYLNIFGMYLIYIFEIYRDKPLEVCTGYTEDWNHLTRFIALRTCINVNHYWHSCLIIIHTIIIYYRTVLNFNGFENIL